MLNLFYFKRMKRMTSILYWFLDVWLVLHLLKLNVFRFPDVLRILNVLFVFCKSTFDLALTIRKMILYS